MGYETSKLITSDTDLEMGNAQRERWKIATTFGSRTRSLGLSTFTSISSLDHVYSRRPARSSYLPPLTLSISHFEISVARD